MVRRTVLGYFFGVISYVIHIESLTVSHIILESVGVGIGDMVCDGIKWTMLTRSNDEIEQCADGAIEETTNSVRQ